MENLWLASLAPADRRRLEPHLTLEPFDRGAVLNEAGQPAERVWFPAAGVVSLLTVLEEGRAVETALVGREGLVGATCGPLNGGAMTRSLAQTAGAGAWAPAAVFSHALEASESLRAALGRYTEALFAQVQQTAACNAQHRLEARLARWLLMVHDRCDEDVIALTQQSLADMLGVRRATVSEVGAALERRGLVRRARGQVEVRDRPGLEAAACGCYAVIRRVMERLEVRPAAA